MRAYHLRPEVLLLLLPLACSAGGATGKVFPGAGSGGSGNGTGSSSSTAGTTGTGSASGAGGVTFFASDGSTGTGGADSSACPRTVSTPEKIIQYVDASYTDTVITLSPIAIYVMQDRSGSMLSNNGWNSSVTAMTQFVSDPASDGLYVGLGGFPPASNNDLPNCATDCNTPIVSIASLPNNKQPMIDGYNNNPASPLLDTPTECGLNGIASACSAFKSSTGINCVGLLITDGTPTWCNTNDTYLANILSTAYTNTGMKTFVLALPGADVARLNTLAAAGQTGTAIDLTGGVDTQKMLDAFNSVRQQVSTQVTSQVTSQTVISTVLPCEWTVPSGVNAGKTNLEFTPDTTSPVEQIGHTTDLAACASVSGDAWYYDPPTGTPTKVVVCPSTCDKIKAAPNPTVNLVFGCDTVDAPIK